MPVNRAKYLPKLNEPARSQQKQKQPKPQPKQQHQAHPRNESAARGGAALAQDIQLCQSILDVFVPLYLSCTATADDMASCAENETTLTDSCPEKENTECIVESSVANIKLNIDHNLEAAFRSKLRQIKDLFLERDYTAIFLNPDLLQVYMAEYSPSRSLCYQNLFKSSPTIFQLLTSESTERKHIYTLGSGSGGELVGVSSLLSTLTPSSMMPVDITIQDIADYSRPLKKLKNSLFLHFPTISPSINIHTHLCSDLLTEDGLQRVVEGVRDCCLITACFVLNELLGVSKKGFVKLIGGLVSNMKKGSFLLVVDSAGSFSEVDMGGRQYMVYNLLDGMHDFEVVEGSDSQWYRFPAGLDYPLKLNNMRYFYRVYRRL